MVVVRKHLVNIFRDGEQRTEVSSDCPTKVCHLKQTFVFLVVSQAFLKLPEVIRKGVRPVIGKPDLLIVLLRHVDETEC